LFKSILNIKTGIELIPTLLLIREGLNTTLKQLFNFLSGLYIKRFTENDSLSLQERDKGRVPII